MNDASTHRSGFQVASALEVIEPGLFRVNIPDGWQQGRGAHGGLVLGTLLRAMIASEPDAARVARTLIGDLAGPVLPGPSVVRTRVHRRGANQTNLVATLEQEGAVLASASSVMSAPRKVSTQTVLPPPPAGLEAPWSTVEVAPVGPPMGPVFAQHFEYRSTGPLPFSGAPDPVTAGWIRDRQRASALDRPAIVALLDAWWPTLYSVATDVNPMATVSFTAEFFADPATLPPDEPLFHAARMRTLVDGFFLEERELWAGGTLVAMNQQTFAVLR
jgi:hypothetical protein